MKSLKFILITLYFLLSIILFAGQSQAKSLDNNELLIFQDKLVNLYSKKFCNAIGIGVSIEGATRLAINENKIKVIILFIKFM